MVNVTLHGAYDTRNFGDLLLLQIHLRWIEEAGGGNVYLPKLTQKISSWITVPASVRLYKGVCGPVYFGGGGYLGAPANNKVKWCINWARQHVIPLLAIKRSGHPVHVIGPGAGPLPPPPLRWLLVSVLRRAQEVWVRDKESAEFLREALGPSLLCLPKVGADAALTLARNPSSDKRRGAPVLGLHLSPPSAKSDEESFAKALAIIERQIQIYPSVRLKGLVDQVGTKGATRQRDFAKALSERAGRPIDIEQMTTVESFCEVIDSCDLIITSKLHVGIVARAFSIPVISISNHQKTPRFYRQIDEEDASFPLSDLSLEDLKVKLKKEFEMAPRRQIVKESVRALADEMRKAFVLSVSENG